MPWGGIAGILATLVVFSVVAVFIDVWWEKRKRDKKRGCPLEELLAAPVVKNKASSRAFE
ncbi:hypothetical protein ES705_36052 [subsurface metagenome]